MLTILTSLLLAAIFITALLYTVFKLEKALVLVKASIDSVNRRIDGIFTVDIPSPNEAVKKDTNTIELSEDNPISIAKDVKIQIEGGDSLIPPGFTEEK